MRALGRSLALLSLFALCGLTACEDDKSPASNNEETACLDRPGQLDRPPAGELPCELLPPGFSR